MRGRPRQWTRGDPEQAVVGRTAATSAAAQHLCRTRAQPSHALPAIQPFARRKGRRARGRWQGQDVKRARAPR
eukprot:3890496-Prymnesium_polylepis.1